MAAKFKIDNDVRDVLRQAVIGPTDLRLTGQLDRKLYERVNKVLAAAGGKWNRSAGAHIFPSDPREILGIAIDTGIATNVRQETQLFPTPPALAARMVKEAGILLGHNILEPSAGTGRILDAIIEDAKVNWTHTSRGKLIAIELDAEMAHRLSTSYRSVTVICADFLEFATMPHQFDRILMNPPFTLGSDIKHIKHAVTFLKPGGRLVAICANSPRQQAELRPLANTWEPLPANTFSESGTGVSTVLLVINA